jgi:hypothetical protein
MYYRLLANFGGNRMQQFILRLFTGTHSRIVLGLIALMLMTLLLGMFKRQGQVSHKHKPIVATSQ